MTVLVESKKMKVTGALRNFAERQARKIAKFKENVTSVRVYLETVAKKKMEKGANIVTYCVSIAGKDVVVTKKAADMYEAIMSATASAVRQLRKVHDKKIKDKRGFKEAL